MKGSIRIVLIFALLLGSMAVFGQRKLVNDQLNWAGGLSVDGDLADWGGQLKHNNPSQKMSYELRNDDQQLFIAIRIVDQQRQVQALTQGVRFMLNMEGKKRPGPAMVFPMVDRISFRSIMSTENENRPEDIRVGALQSVRGIQVLRIGDLLDGLISLDNQYGIEVGAMIDQDDALCIEMRLPFSLVTSRDKFTGSQVAYNIKVGGRGMMSRDAQGQAPSMRTAGSPGGYSGAMPRGGLGTSTSREDEGVWGLIRFAGSKEQLQVLK